MKVRDIMQYPQLRLLPSCAHGNDYKRFLWTHKEFGNNLIITYVAAQKKPAINIIIKTSCCQLKHCGVSARRWHIMYISVMIFRSPFRKMILISLQEKGLTE